jgi:hypothetical protein
MGPRIFDARNPPAKVAQIRVAHNRYFNHKAPANVLGKHCCGKFRANRAE